MSLIELLLTSVGLAMDAFAVSICKGLSMKKFNLKKGIEIGLYFGFFQGIMPLIGFSLGRSFESLMTSIDHWVVFILLSLIGFSMIIESFSYEKEKISDSVDFKSMFSLSIATSIDSLAIGISLAFLKVNILFAVLIISLITFILSLIGAKIGYNFGNIFENKTQIIGGIMLILIGIRILFEHLGISFL